MNFDLLITNFSNPTLLFFLLGILAVIVKSDLSIPESTSRFISIYLLFSIGFKGGQELAHSGLNQEVLIILALSVALAVLVPFYSFFLLKRRMTVDNAGAIAAAYGSVSAVTFVTAISFLENSGIAYGGHMVASMALMESPAIIVGVLLMRYFTGQKTQHSGIRTILHESVTNASVFIILGSLFIGMVADTKQAEGIKPFTTDIFKGFLAIFLLEMGMVAAKRFGTFKSYGLFLTMFALVVPLVNGLFCIAVTSALPVTSGNRLLLAALAASASYIAVPAAMRQVAPEADPGLYIPMALGVTFPFNITIGLPLFWMLING